jgi:hypothetical protein
MSTKLSARRQGSSPSKGPSVAGHGGELSLTAWKPRCELDAQEWVTLGNKLGKIGRASQWWIGDWIRYGTARWGEKYASAARITGYDVASLRNIAWVAAQFDPSLRSDELTWSHHAVLAPLDRQEKEYWLKLAIERRLSVSDLRLELRASQRSSGGGRSQKGNRQIPHQLVCPKCGHRLPDKALAPPPSR